MDRVAAEDLPTAGTDVLVVGAGPTGLMAGLLLARRGVPVVVVDRKAGPTRESRALAVQARTMELYDQLGLVDEVVAGSYRATRIQVGPGSDLLGFGFEQAQRGATRYPGLHVFEQSRNEELLSAAFTAAGPGVRWRHRLLDLVEGEGADGGVVALLDGPDGLTRVRARWCVGADGATSVVRRLLDVPFEGVTDDATFWVADLRGVEGLPDRALAARLGRRTFGVMFPLGPGGHARLISMASGDHVDADAALATARDDLGLRYDALDWFSTYRVHHRVAARFRKGSTFLAGDAAHVHSPVGGQGMNTGLQDAHDLANLLADVAQGHLDARGARPLRARAAPRRAPPGPCHGPAVRRGRPARPADRLAAPEVRPGARAPRPPRHVRPARRAPRGVAGPVPDPLPPRPARRAGPRLGRRPGRRAAPAAGRRQRGGPARVHLAAAHVRRPRGPAGRPAWVDGRTTSDPTVPGGYAPTGPTSSVPTASSSRPCRCATGWSTPRRPRPRWTRPTCCGRRRRAGTLPALEQESRRAGSLNGGGSAAPERPRSGSARRGRSQGQAVTSNVAVASAVELVPTQTSKVEGSRTQSRSAAFQ